jgi:hypothetical protein
MALNYIYSDSTGSTIDITDRCRLYQLSVKDQAEEGAVAISSLTIDDPDGDLEITGHRRLYIFEDTAPAGDQVIYNGFTSNERIIRGPSGRTGASRQWVVDLADVNVLINRRIMNGPDANRPAETDLERIQALLTMTELNTVDDDSLVNTTAETVDMDAADYRGQNVGQYIDDCRQASGKNAYIYYNETLGEYGLWYDFAQSTAYDSGCFLSNTIGESNGTTVFNYSIERTYLNRDPSRVASGIYLEYDGGLVYAQNPVTTDNFAAIDWAAPSVNVKTLAKATARADRYLVDAASEHEVIHVVQTDVPRASVNAIKKGHLVSFKASYMTGYEDYTVCRVLYRQVTEIAEDPESSFEIEMDLDPLPPEPLCLAAQNSVIESSNREAVTGWVDSGLADLRGTTWAYVATNTHHSDNAITTPRAGGTPPPKQQLFTWMLAVGQGPPSAPGSSIGFPGELDIMVQLSPLSLSQGTAPPFSILPVQTGTFTVPSVLESNPNLYPCFGFTVNADYGAGPTTVNEGYEVCLTRIG